jgi:hypothetical protein
MMPVHQCALADCGVYLIENLALEGLAAEKIHKGCFILLATRLKGATGTPSWFCEDASATMPQRQILTLIRQ